MFAAAREKLLCRLAAPLTLAVTLLLPSPAAARRVVVYPAPVHPAHLYPPPYPYYPAADYYYPGRLCNRTERRWVPANVRYDRYGNVERVRGRMVTVRVRVPC